MSGAAKPDPRRVFHTNEQLRLNARRTEHLAWLGVVRPGKSVLEVGAGLGDLTMFFTSRGCKVGVTDGRADLVEMTRAGQSMATSRQASVLDLERCPAVPGFRAEIVVCYGVLHLISTPGEVLGFLRACSAPTGMLLLETRVSAGRDESLNPCEEPTDRPDGSISGRGCRPTRPWVWNTLKKLYPHVYLPRSQPCHDEFPLDWAGTIGTPTPRAVFVASMTPLNNPRLAGELLDTQHAAGTET
ncbi:MAG: methyltransferase domain-containing protein [Phycisphaerales bacterium]|jgi:hypothetical protein|nr:methyltransferase domain-containing protein [Phycisphaerales bacterium]